MPNPLPGCDDAPGSRANPPILRCQRRASARPVDYTPSSMSVYTIETGGELLPALSQEWLLTNGLGGFSSGTVVGCNTRRYHALLCAATMPPVGRMVLLNRIGEILRIGQDVHEFSVNQFSPHTFQPRGERYLRRFVLGDVARWEYDVAGAAITKEVLLCWQRDVVVIRYHVRTGGQRVALELLPVVSIRDFHSLQLGTSRRYDVASDAGHTSVKSGDHTLHLHCDEAPFKVHADWWKAHWYGIEAERGQDHVEDLYTPGRFAAELSSDATVTVVASLQRVDPVDWDAEVKRRAGAFAGSGRSPAPSVTVRRLERAANDFVVSRSCPDGSAGVTVIAGYPWFADWGRDTMISLPGLFLTTGRFKEAQQVLSVFASYVTEGMIPNKFDDYTNEPHYNTVDASLWFIHACHEYLRTSKDRQTFNSLLLPACREIIAGYTRGTRFHIRMDEADGLITQGDPNTQLTWMDARCNGVSFTPRQGKAVEINALWYNALMLMGEEKRAAQVRLSFGRAFWISPFRGLCDVVDGDRRDSSIRPNQIFAVSLPHSPLERDQQHAVVEVVRRELLTPFGLRTLDANHPNFHPTFTGTQFERDRAYHNGTIWPWLIGAFLEAYLKVHDRAPDSVRQARQWLTPLIESMARTGCIGSIAEVFEAREPHRAAGCCAQAWSVAEALRLAVELEM
jgi:predicted glycogen debranching enzyme